MLELRGDAIHHHFTYEEGHEEPKTISHDEYIINLLTGTAVIMGRAKSM